MKAQELFERVTADLVAAIEDGAGDWRMPWRRLGAGLPRSVDGRPYRGWNALVLAMVAGDRGWSSARWATYRGWQRHGGQVHKGERGTHVVLWKPTERHDQREDGTETVHRSLFARTFTVFAAEQVDGADRWLTPVELAEGERIARADAYFAEVGADVVHGGDRACYVPALDRIHLPARSQFDTPAAYYTTAAHEHTHWTGHPDRLARDLSGRFGTDAYGSEELVAELGAAFWSAQFGLEQATRHDHAAYLGDWLRILRADPRAIVAACGHAQRAVDLLNELAGWTVQADTAADQALSA